MAEADIIENAAVAVLEGDDPRVELLPLIGMLASQPERFPATKHVLGFLHCKLGELDGRTLRLHIWPDTERLYGDPQWPVHTHHWTISSAVVAGHVVNETFAVWPDIQGQSQLYEVHYAGNGLSERRRTDERVVVVKNDSETWRAGDRYDIPLGTYHSTTVPEGTFAATIIVTGTRTDALPLVLGQASGKAQYHYSAEEPAAEAWVQALSKLQRSIQD
jgi:hypothetical protein